MKVILAIIVSCLAVSVKAAENGDGQHKISCYSSHNTTTTCENSDYCYRFKVSDDTSEIVAWAQGCVPENVTCQEFYDQNHHEEFDPEDNSTTTSEVTCCCSADNCNHQDCGKPKSPTNAPTNKPTEDEDDDFSGGAIAGIIIGALVLAGISFAAVTKYRAESATSSGGKSSHDEEATKHTEPEKPDVERATNVGVNEKAIQDVPASADSYALAQA